MKNGILEIKEMDTLQILDKKFSIGDLDTNTVFISHNNYNRQHRYIKTNCKFSSGSYEYDLCLNVVTGELENLSSNKYAQPVLRAELEIIER